MDRIRIGYGYGGGIAAREELINGDEGAPGRACAAATCASPCRSRRFSTCQGPSDPSDPSHPSDPSDPSDPSESATVLHFGEERRTWRQFYTLSTWPRCPEVATVAQFDAPETNARVVWKRAPRTATEHILSNSEPEVAKGLRLR